MSAQLKEFFRTIARSPGRFLALLAIVALGAGFYAGLRMTSPDMKLALDGYLDAQQAYDIRVVSTLGLTDDDLQQLAQVEGVQDVQGALQTDAEALLNGSDYVVRFHSLTENQNQLVLAQGRLPEQAGECVVCADRVMDSPVNLGDVLQLDGHDANNGAALDPREFTVVGMVRSPYYVSQVSLGTSSVGSGLVHQYAYVLPSDFKRTMPYSEAFITAAGAQQAFMGSSEYWRAVDDVKQRIEDMAPEREQHRIDTVASLSSLRFYDELPSYDAFLDVLKMNLENATEDSDELTCEWLVMDRNKNTGIVSFSSDADRVDHIASVFPFVFFLVAALVALTTMTRMVDEERMVIGTYKALGYSRARITAKYLGYALLASGVGAVLGIVVLGQLLPAVIMNAYVIMYHVPGATYPLNVPISLLSAGLCVGICLLATWFAAAHTLRSRPAALMLPPAPKNGKRILLERFTPLWQRLSFSWKVTFRNLFRYKKRFIMTIIGIAGCTALLLTGLGLHDAINDIIDVQYSEIVHYNATFTAKDNAAGKQGSSQREHLDEVLQESPYVYTSTTAHVHTVLASGPRTADKRSDVVVPSDPTAFAQLNTLRTRNPHRELSLNDGEVVINEKLALDLGVGIGDTITVAEQDTMGNATSETYEVKVTGLCEVYIYNFLFMNQATYESIWGQPPSFRTYFAQVTSNPEERAQLDDQLQLTGAVKTASYNDETINTYRTMLRSVDLIVLVLVVAAGALAFIVLYNLTNINIAERVREIATLKVLGFTRGETRAYIFREVALLAVIGCVLGIALGVPLEGFVVTTAEVDQVMFGRSIHAFSFGAAFVLTLLFSAISMLLMAPKLARINMVESLKSNE